MSSCYTVFHYGFLHISDPPVIDITDKTKEEKKLRIDYKFYPPITWHGDLYSWDKCHSAQDSISGQCEKELMQEIYRKVRTIIEWEQRRVSENIGTLIST